MATEVILMQCVKAGGDRQALHEAVREHSMEAGKRVKGEGANNDLLERIAGAHASIVSPLPLLDAHVLAVDTMYTWCLYV